MKICIDLFEFQEKLIFTPQNSYDLFHNYFYFCLLPKNFKIKLLSQVDSYANEVLSNILNINYNSLVNFNESDFFVPYIPSIFSDISEYIFHYSNERYKNKKILLFYGGDDDYINVKRDNIILLSASGIKNDDKISIPTICKDFFDNKLIRKKLSVGFCGTLSSEFRKKIIDILFNEVYCNFIIRRSWGNVDKLLDGVIMSHEKTPSEISQKEYYQNIESNLYTLCVRGAGNFSFRLAETFMMGRIPVLVDSDCTLPFSDKIPYHKNTVYITKENSNNFRNISDLIENYHNSHTEDELLKIQYQNRQIWLDYFRIDSAFYQTLNILKSV